MRLFIALLAVPLIEIALFIQVGGWLGLWPTLALVVLTAVLGTLILRVQGARALADIRRALNSLSDPTAPLAHGAMILIAGVLLLTPGFFTDATGFALLVPGVRAAILSRVGARISVRGADAAARPAAGPAAGPRRSDDRVIDADYHEVQPGVRPTHPPSGWTRH